jgi:hypothetical protein
MYDAHLKVDVDANVDVDMDANVDVNVDTHLAFFIILPITRTPSGCLHQAKYKILIYKKPP